MRTADVARRMTVASAGDSLALIKCSETHPLLFQLAEPHLYADTVVTDYLSLSTVRVRASFQESTSSLLGDPQPSKLNLSYFFFLPLFVLDNSKNIKNLTLSDCIAISEPISESPHQQHLETLTIHDEAILSWAISRGSNLKSFELWRRWKSVQNHDWTGCLRLLADCSSSLTRLHLPVGSPLSIFTLQ